MLGAMSPLIASIQIKNASCLPWMKTPVSGPGKTEPVEERVFGKIQKEDFAVKRNRFAVEQIVGILKQAEVGVPVMEVIRKAGISEQTFYRWKKQYVGLEVD